MRRPVLFTALSVAALTAALTAAPARSQATLAKPVWTGISAKAQKQIEDVSRTTQRYAAQDTARAHGFIPVLGWIPTMGTHWVDNPRMFMEGKTIDLNSPVQLMYSPVNGKEMLVGAAYSYITQLTDSTRPSSFDGNPSWHEHPDLVPDGMRLVMLHVWFVPSPDGPFAGHNPNLPFWAAGITPPDAQRLKDPAEEMRIRKTAMALAVVADSAGLLPLLHRRPAVRDAETVRGDSIRALLPELDGAAKAHDWARWDRAADLAVVQWDALTVTWLAATTRPGSKVRVQRYIDDMTMSAHDMASMHHH